MLKDSKTEAEHLTGTALAMSGVSRRCLVRAGLAAAPVMLALKSPSALATGSAGTGNHMTCSAWASVSAAKGCRSSHTAQHVGATCNHYGYWKDQTHQECGKRFHSHASGAHVPFYGTDCNISTNAGTFVPTLKEICKGQFIQPVITITGYNWRNNEPIKEYSYPAVTTGDVKKDLLAKHCAAMHLNATVDQKSPLSTDTVKQIWGSCKNGGDWTPPNGGKAWSRDECIDYFEYVCKGTIPSSWGTTCA